MAAPLSDEELKERLLALRKDYLSQLPEKLNTLHSIWKKEKQQQTPEKIQEFIRLVHNLTGSGATFGFHEISTTSRNIENFVQSLLDKGIPIPDEQMAQVNALLLELKGLIESSSISDSGDDPQVQISKKKNKTNSESRLVFLIEDDLKLAEELVLQLNPYGYVVRTFHSTHGVKEAINATPPDAIISDVMLKEGMQAGPKLIAEIKQEHSENLPVIFVSAQDNLKTRLQTVRAGSSAYLTKPLDVGSLIDTLDKLTTQEHADPYRIMIVDDSQTLASFYATTLESVHMETQIVTNPLTIFDSIEEFNPELILMDMYMPECTGIELSSVIRQQPTYLSIPIVYLSAETNIGKQLDAMSMGGDDFLTKPIIPAHLISSVTSRAERYRTLRSMMIRDSLTGLLNHTAIKERLDVELFRAKREKSPLSFAMIDIDHFKSVNDTYGHPTGDRVIKGLSRLLQQRLRKSDVIGRYGGEEFAVILPNTTHDTAQRVLDELRDGFSQIKHKSDSIEFSISFSCGIASSAHTDNPVKLNDSADKALYQAKKYGRNQVTIFSVQTPTASNVIKLAEEKAG